MTCLSRFISSAIFLASCSLLPGQTPVDPPPWWGVADNVTVSLFWDFNAPFQPGQPTINPTFQVAPPWYSNPSPWTAGGNVNWIANLGNHQGVMGLTGTGSPIQADVSLFVDNDPHFDWVKIFWFQFDAFEGSSGEIANRIEESLTDYGRASVTQRSASLGGGWERITVSAELIPQPDDETISLSFLENAFGTVGIDNLFVNSKCVKPRPDEEGDALGKVTTQSINLTQATNGAACRAVAVVTGNPQAPVKSHWVAALGGTTTAPHRMIQLDANGAPTGITTLLPSNPQQAPLGPTDLTVERVPTIGGGFQEWVYAILDHRPTGGPIHIRALDANANANGALVPSRDVVIPPNAPIGQGLRLSIAFDPSGNLGNGTFWITGREISPPFAWKALEFNRAGQLLDEMPVPNATHGFDYDDTLGNFYSFSAEAFLPPSGQPIEVNGTEISGYNQDRTGVAFCGDLNIPNPGGPAGGRASGMTVYRLFNGPRSELRMACVVDAGPQQFFYELAGPFRYGYSRFGTCGMQNGPPFVGGSFDITLSGVPTSLLAMMFLGTNSANIPLSPGVQAESVGSIVPTVSTPFLAPINEGEFSVTVQLPNSSLLGYSETFFQWVVLDSTAPGFLGFSQAGKTVIYP